METKTIGIELLESNQGQIAGLAKNPRKWAKHELDKLKKSITDTPELLEARGLLVYPFEGRYLVLGGNMRLEACKELGLKELPCIILPEQTSVAKLREIVIKDNGSFGEWDWDMISADWGDLALDDWGVPDWEGHEAAEAEEIERKRQEFKERIAAGEMSESDPDYQAFLEKFRMKKTTDDCYTPDLVYEAVAEWVAKEYNLNTANFVRPFYPGGDYVKEKYKSSDVVVDNPPFSILAEILRFYSAHGIKYFLFAPHLTLFSSSSSSSSSMLVVGVTVTYANGAVVNTSFITNLEPKDIQFRSEPRLYAAVKEANDNVLKEQKKELPKYSYDPHVLMSAMVAPFSRLGIDFMVRRDQCVRISELDAQKAAGKGIFGSGYLCSDGVKAEREKAEREKAEREKAERWELSDRERAIVQKLSSAD